LKHALVGLPQISDMAALVARFQDCNAALDLESLFLRKLARAQVVEQNEVGADLPRESMALISPRPRETRRD